MRFLKLPLYLLLCILALTSIPKAQISCGPDPSPFDFVSMGAGNFGGPGDTVNVPVNITNTLSIGALEILMEYDKRIVNPIITDSDFNINYGYQFDTISTDPLEIDTSIVVIDTSFTNYLDFDTTGGRMINPLNGTNPVYSLLVFEALENPSIDPNIGRLKVFINPLDFINLRSAIGAGEGAAFYIPFVVNPAAAHNATGNFRIYDVPIFDNSFPPNLISCAYSSYSDTTGDIGGFIRFTGQQGNFIVDTTNYICPTINSFSVSPSQIIVGQQATLSWDVADADSVIINNGVGSFTATTGSVNVNPASAASYTYTLTAYGSCPSTITANTTLTVNPIGSNNTPQFQSVAGAPFTISQGETVAFTVSATDADTDDILTLTATSLPNNANFSQSVGTGSVSGNFSFTPDINQSGTFTITFQVTDNNSPVPGTANLNVVINVEELQFDVLFTTSALGQKPVGGLKGKEAIYLPINMVTSQTVYGVQFDFLYNPLYFTVDSFVVTGRTVDYVIYDNIGQTPGNIKVVTFGLANEPVATVADTTAILYAVMSIDSNATPGDYPIYFENGWESVNPDPNVPSLELVVDSGVIQVDNPGDVNLDKRIDVADLVSVVASIIQNFTLSSRQFDVADIITNDTVNVFDLVGIVNLIYGIPINPSPTPLFDDERATINLVYNDLQVGGNEMLVINSETPVDLAAVEVDIEYDPTAISFKQPKLAADAQGMTIRYKDDAAGKMKILVHFNNPFSGELIDAGIAEMIEIEMTAKEDIRSGDKEQLKITLANFSTSSAAKVEVDGVDIPNTLPSSFFLSQNYPNPFNPTTRIDFAIESNQHVRLDVYNILGQLVNTLVDNSMPAGAHSIEWDATSSSGSRVASGVYLYRLTVENHSQSKKMLFLK